MAFTSGIGHLGADAAPVILIGMTLQNASASLRCFDRVFRLKVEACLMEGKIDLSARMQVTNKLPDAYGKASQSAPKWGQI